MKRILFIVLDVLLLIIICICIFKGVSIGSFRIQSFQDIKDLNAQLSDTIVEANKKNQDYSQQLDKIKTDTAALTKAKKAYLDLMTVSTDNEIQEALQTKTYSIEYLWSQVGNHATKEGVITKMELSASSVGDPERRNLNFTITGSYLSMTNFISDLENDSDLDFTIDGFDMTNKRATFVVKDIKIKKEKTSVSSNESSAKNSSDNNRKSTASDNSGNQSSDEQSTEKDNNNKNNDTDKDKDNNSNSNNNNSSEKTTE